MTLKSHITQWVIVAKHLNTSQKSLENAKRRFSCGLPFFTNQLPSLGKDLEAGLTGKFVLSSETPFSVRNGSALPAFLYEHFIKIFYKDGYVRPNPVGIADLRFLLKMYYKFESPMTSQEVKAACDKFNETDRSVKTDQYPYGLSEVRKNFMSLFPENPLDISPRHSGGASSMFFSNYEKRYARHYIPRLMDVFDARYFFNTNTHASNWCAVNKTTEALAYPRVTFVPKDSRGPRTICIYHHQDMFIQKGLQEKLYEFTEKGDSPARGFINFTDQSVNQRLAYEGSIHRNIATIDLKDASDMVPWNLVKMLVPPDWYAALAATRTDFAQIQGDIVPLKKYAPMGSALCFPIEAFVFWSIAKTVSPWVYVYGDDIIVPTESADDVIAALESYGLVVNVNKTLIKGHFRESCGGDYYNGHNINYTSCKSYDLQQYIAFCNEVAERHDQELAEQLLTSYESLYDVVVYRRPLELKCRLEPYIFYTDRHISSRVFFKHRWNEHLQREEVFRKHIVARPEKAIDSKKRQRRRSKLSVDFTPTEDDFLFQWFVESENSVAPLEDSKIHSIEREIFVIPTKATFFSEGHQTLQQDTYPVTKYAWGTTM